MSALISMKPRTPNGRRSNHGARGTAFILLVAVGLTCWRGTAGDLATPKQTSEVPPQLVEPQGRVEVLRRDTSFWLRATNTLTLYPGDTVRTGADSRALVKVSSHSTVRLGELTLFQLRQPPEPAKPLSLRLLKGVLYFFHRDRPAAVDFETPLVTGAIRGTEFALRVEEDGRSRLSLLDGEVDLSNQQGSLRLVTGQVGVAEVNGTLTRTSLLQAVEVIQWCLYYPAVLDLDELPLDSNTAQVLENSISSYRAGDLIAALKSYPAAREPVENSEKVFRAALLLGAGEVEPASSLLASVSAASPQVRALNELIAAVTAAPSLSAAQAPPSPTASELLAQSYRLQARFDLSGALQAASRATKAAPRFGFAWARLAELEFSSGHRAAADSALRRSLELSPRNAQALALKGFLLAAEDKTRAAIAAFDEAIAADSALGNAWLGRGLCRIRRWDSVGGQADLLIAASLEPNRALLRSYLGKAFAQSGETARAAKELALAKRLDPNDPTAWLYSALLNEQRNRINQAIADLEESKTLNDNRRLYRSRLLLDQDEAVRGANLANLYRDAGLDQVGVREAVHAVSADYANFSAHLFLANTYNLLRDPGQVNLRYETPWLSEFLVANLLAPVGAGTLSQTVSEQEYGKLFERNRLGVASSTEYLSRGDWTQAGSQFGNTDRAGYALDTLYRSLHGERPNQDLDQLTLSFQFKQEITPEDSIYFQPIWYHADAGDLTQYYDPAMAHLQRRVTESQEPLILLGYHHEWAPGCHTLFLAGRLQDSLQLDDPIQPVLALLHGPSPTDLFVPVSFLNPAEPVPVGSLDYQSEYNAGTFELQQIFKGGDHTLIFGARGQFGEVSTTSLVGSSLVHLTNLVSATDLFFLTDPVGQDLTSQFNRESFYAYDYWHILTPLTLVGGVSYDRLEFPLNYRIPPISTETDVEEQVSPKAGVVWNVGPRTVLRGAYARSLGGVSFDQSFRLEPPEIAGFLQAFRSVAPESVVGEVGGAHFRTGGVALDQTFPTRTYFGAQAEWVNSTADRLVGAVDVGNTLPPGFSASSTPQHLDATEKSLLVTVDQLLGNDWSFGASYRLSRMELQQSWPELTSAIGPAATSDLRALLHQLTLAGLFNHPCGFFARGEAVWLKQNNDGYSPALPGDDLWQFNVFAGYRFARRRIEITIGGLNLSDRDYHLNPLNLHFEFPHHRTFMTSLKFSF
jgi:tetratricopeptide (TPR) repeat protein